MKNGIAARLGRIVAPLVLALTAFGANAADLVVVLDTDNNAATGCTITTPSGSFAGAEVVLTTTVDTSVNPPMVGAVTQQACVAPPLGLGAPVAVSPGGWNVGLGLGVGGYDVIETVFPIGTPPAAYRVGFFYTDPLSGTDVLFTLGGIAGAPVIVFALPGFGNPVPTITEGGIFLLALLLFVAAARALRRYQVPTTLMVGLFAVIMTSAALAAIVLDGQITDWVGIRALATDQTGDAPSGSDISAVFAKAENGNIYFRADVKTASVPVAAGDTYSTLSGVPLAVPAGTGVLANDNRGIPAATVTSFGGGSLGGTVTTNAAGSTANFGAGGSVTLNADGSFAFTPPAAFTGPATFNYRITNPSGDSAAMVTITVNQAPVITSGNATTFSVGTANTFAVTATGYPAPALTFGACAPALPAGVGFVDNGGGSGTLSGNPPSGSSGTYNCTVGASNSVASASQPFALTITEGAAAVADAYSVAHDTPLLVPAPGVLANDSGAPPPTVTAVVTPAANGVVAMGPDGSFTYTPNANFAGSDSFVYTADNGVGSSNATVTITVTNVAPVVDLNGPAAGIGFTAAFGEGAVPVAIVDGAQLTVSDADDANLESATVAITNLADDPDETLAVSCPDAGPGCSGAIQAADVVYDPNTGVLTITASAPLADYQALLRTLTYRNAADDPDTAARVITVTVSDGIVANAPVAQATVTMTATNDAPTITAPAAITTAVNTPHAFAGTVSVGDVDSGTSPVVVTLAATNGIATLSTTAGLTVVGNGSASVTSTGPLAAQNTALNGMQYTPAPGYNGAATLKIDIDDQGNTGTGGALTATRTVNITVDNQPSVTGTTPANGATNVADGSTITVNFSEAVSITAGTFTLECPAATPTPFTVSPAGPAASFTLTPVAPLPAGVTCTLTVVANQVTDTSSQNMAANFIATFGTNTRPTVTSTTPANGATAVVPGSTVIVNFSESVTAPLAAFGIACPVGSPQGFAVTSSPATSFTLTPSVALPSGTTCTVTVFAAQVTDSSSQNMSANFVFSFATGASPAITSANSAAFTIGQPNTFTITTTGSPTVSSIVMASVTPGPGGTLPSGVAFDYTAGANATLSGTPTTAADAGTYLVSFTAANGIPPPAVQNPFTLTLACPTITVNGVLGNHAYNTPFSSTFTNTGGNGAISWSATGLPAGESVAAGTGVVSGTPSVTGSFTAVVTATDAFGCTGSATRNFDVVPAVGPDGYDAIPNVIVDSSTGVPFSVVANDSFPAGATITAFDATSANGGAVTMTTAGANLGRFTYDPPVGFTGFDTFNYTLTSNGISAIGTVTFNVAGNRIWFVNNNGGACPGAPCDGRMTHPFATTAAFQSVNDGGALHPAANDTVFMYGSVAAYPGSVTLLANQGLMGQGALTPLAARAGVTPRPGQTLPATGGTAPTLSSPGSPLVTLGANNNVTGVILGSSSVAVTGNGFGNVFILDVASIVNPTGQAMLLQNGNATVALVGTTSAAGINNVRLAGIAGSLTLGTGALSGATGDVFSIDGGTANVTYGGTITSTGPGARPVSVINKTAGTVTFNGAVSTTAGSAGVLLNNNTGATIAFTGGVQVTTASSTAFQATAGGTVTVTGTTNGAITTNATSVDIQNTAIGAAGVTFNTVNSSGGANGIVLVNTGAGTFTVDGDGSSSTVGGNGSGGTISNKTGATGSTAGIGVYMLNTGPVALRRMVFGGFFDNYGIKGLSVGGASVEYSNFSGVFGDNAAGIGEGAIYFGDGAVTGLTGTSMFRGNSIGNGRVRNVSIVNRGGSATVNFLGNQFNFNSTAGDGLQSLMVEAQTVGTSITSTVGSAASPNSFQGAPGDLINFTGRAGTTITATVESNNLQNTHVGNTIGGGGMTFASDGVMTATVKNNTQTGASGSAITLQMTNVGTVFNGRLEGNQIGTVGVVNSGSVTGNGLFGSFAGSGDVRLLIDNNRIHGYSGNAGMFFDNTGGNYGVDMTVSNNVVATPGPGVFYGLAITNGAPLSADQIDVCAAIFNNDFSAGDPADANDIILGISGDNAGHVFRLPGYAGSTLGAVQTYVQGLNFNPGTTVVSAYSDSPAATMFTGGAPCLTPP